MARLTPRGHTADSRELVMAVTGRAPLELVHDASVMQAHKEMACTAGGPPSVPARRNRRPQQPRLSPIKRLVLMLNRWRASFF